MPTNPIEYRRDVRGFGTWRIAYDPRVKHWQLVYNLKIKGERWNTVRQFDLLEAALVAVANRTTGFDYWDQLGFGRGMNLELSKWKTEASEGVQRAAVDF